MDAETKARYADALAAAVHAMLANALPRSGWKSGAQPAKGGAYRVVMPYDLDQVRLALAAYREAEAQQG